MSWKEYAACRGVADVNFFPEPKEGRWASIPARETCAGCFVRAQCLDWALAHDEVGIWGGTSEVERKYIRARYVRSKNSIALYSGTAVQVGL